MNSHFLPRYNSSCSRVRDSPPAEFRDLNYFHQRAFWYCKLFCFVECRRYVFFNHNISTADMYGHSFESSKVAFYRELKDG